MRTLLLIFLIGFIPGIAVAQHDHFIYIQGENQQTFYMKKSGDLISSSATGFVIIPKLQAGTHQFIIGFPKKQWPEYEFQVEINSADRGFTLKNFGDKGWGLFDLQSLDIIYGKKIDPPKAEVIPEKPKSDDPFSVILASAVGDQGIRETALVAMKFDKPSPVAAKTVPPPSQPVAKAETSVVKAPPPAPKETKTSPEKTVIVPPPVPDGRSTAPPPTTGAVASQSNTQPNKKEDVKAAPAFESAPVLTTIPTQPKPDTVQSSVAKNNYPLYRQIRKISEIKSWKTTELIYVDVNGSSVDTITLIIEKDSVEETKQPAEAPAPVTLSNRQDCKEMATEKDMLNLRKKVLRLKTEEEMLELTLKDIRAKCYTVEMLQNTSYVFISDKMRYSLFESALPFIYDPSNYGKLERLLSTDEYMNRFRELIKTK